MNDPIQRDQRPNPNPNPQQHADTVPARDAGSPRDPMAAPAANQASEAGAAGVILVAENEENNRLLMEQILSMAGYEYVSASNGAEVLSLLERYPVDVVLLDLSMPVLDGFRTTQMIRRTPKLASLPVVAVTGHASREDREEALEAGCTDYLAKPFRTQELVAVVQRMLARRNGRA
ncbi:MAG TPA: response regulator [Ktedonobacterales bacterium]